MAPLATIPDMQLAKLGILQPVPPSRVAVDLRAARLQSEVGTKYLLELRNFSRKCSEITHPEGPARHLDVSGQKLSPHCLETNFDSQLPSPKLSPKMPPKLSLPHRRGHFFLFQNYPCGEGNCEAIERQKLSRGNFCPGTSRCLAGPTGQNV